MVPFIKARTLIDSYGVSLRKHLAFKEFNQNCTLLHKDKIQTVSSCKAIKLVFVCQQNVFLTQNNTFI